MKEEQQNYEDLKKKLMQEYKKIQKKGGNTDIIKNEINQVQQQQMQSYLQQKNQMAQIEETLQNSAKALSDANKVSQPTGANLASSINS